MTRLSISADTDDPLVRVARSQVREHHVVDGVRGVIALVQAAAQPCRIDLIAHSHDGVLQLGGWRIDAAETGSAAMIRELPRDAIREIWLLGCMTAALPAGIAAMRALKAKLAAGGRAVKVYGTTTMIGAEDFGPEGFARSGLTIEIADVPPPWFAQ